MAELKDKLIAKFSAFSWDDNAEWIAHLKKLDPTPTGHLLEKRKRKWFRDNIEAAFDLDWFDIKAHVKTVTSSQPNMILSENSFSTLYIIGIVTLFWSLIPFIGSWGIPIPFTSHKLYASTVSMVALTQCLYRLTGGIELTNFKNSPIFSRNPWTISLLMYLVGSISTSSILHVAGALHILQEFSKDEDIRRETVRAIGGFLNTYKPQTQYLCEQVNYPFTSVDQLVKTELKPKIDMAEMFFCILRVQIESISTLVMFLYALVALLTNFQAGMVHFCFFISFCILVKWRYAESIDMRNSFFQINQSICGYVPNVLMPTYTQITDFIYNWATRY